MTKCQHVLKFWKYTKCCMILSQSFNFILTPLKPFLPPFPSVWVPLSWEAVVRQVVSNSLQPHELQHVRLPCPSLYPRVCSEWCPLSQWCYLTIFWETPSAVSFPRAALQKQSLPPGSPFKLAALNKTQLPGRTTLPVSRKAGFGHILLPSNSIQRFSCKSIRSHDHRSSLQQYLK